MTVNKLMQEHELEFQPFFNKEIFLIMAEAELLEQLGKLYYTNIHGI